MKLPPATLTGLVPRLFCVAKKRRPAVMVIGPGVFGLVGLVRIRSPAPDLVKPVPPVIEAPAGRVKAVALLMVPPPVPMTKGRAEAVKLFVTTDSVPPFRVTPLAALPRLLSALM